MVNKLPVLYIAGVSISENPKDISPKTLQVIRDCDFVVGEERKSALRLLNVAGVTDKPLFLINEHSNDSEREEVMKSLIEATCVVLFSDAGTPCISDPDYKLVSMAKNAGVKVKSLPGASSLTAALSVSGIEAATFFFAGFPPREKEKRKLFFAKLVTATHVTVFMERPYALMQTLDAMKVVERKVSLSIDLGNEGEENYFETPANLTKLVGTLKVPFVMVVPPLKK